MLRHFPPPYPSAADGAITKSGLKTSAGNSDRSGQQWYSCRQKHLSKLWNDVWYVARRYVASIPLFDLFGFKALKVKFYLFGCTLDRNSCKLLSIKRERENIKNEEPGLTGPLPEGTHTKCRRSMGEALSVQETSSSCCPNISWKEILPLLYCVRMEMEADSPLEARISNIRTHPENPNTVLYIPHILFNII